MNTDELPLVLWWVGCFDKGADQPFPVQTRVFVLEWDSLTKPQIEEVLKILDSESPTGSVPSDSTKSVISLKWCKARPDNRMLKFRKFFVELEESELQERTLSARNLANVELHREYFEDENGDEITIYEMLQHVSGQSEPIVIGDPNSVRKLALSRPKNKCEWNEDAANTIAQFLDVVRRICNSDWYRNPQSITLEVAQGLDSARFPKPGESELLAAAFPNDSETMAIIAYFRQLHAGDRLLERACNAFIKTCGDERKNRWIIERRDAFNEMIDQPPRPWNTSFSRREIVRMFMYGAGLLHANSNHGDDRRLEELIETHGKHRAVAIFNHCLNSFLALAITVYQVIEQEFDNWIANHGLAKPTRVDIGNLFSGFSSAQDGRGN